MEILFFVVFIIGCVFGCIFGNLYANTEKDELELADPEVHEIKRTIYWISNVHKAYNDAIKIIEDNPDKFRCLKIYMQDKPYNHNRFYLRYKSIGNKYLIKLTLGHEDTPCFTIEENKQ